MSEAMIKRFSGIPAAAMLRVLDGPAAGALLTAYGSDAAMLSRRVALLRAALERFASCFGELPCRIFRCPGRINLRGMHVDTHGGYLNLMTHEREVLAVAGVAEDGTYCFHNLDAEFGEVGFSTDLLETAPAFRESWAGFIGSPEVVRTVSARQGAWDNYLLGAVLRARFEARDTPACGLRAVIAGDLPRGAALSSSHALCVCVLLAALEAHGCALDKRAMILAVRDAEWFTGARTGTSDQGAEILGERGALINAALFAEDFTLDGVRRVAFPDDARVVIVNSFTKRNLSGAQRVAYTTNRFAYSMAMAIARHELRAMGFDDAAVARVDRLSRLTPETVGGVAGMYRLLQNVPETLPLREIPRRYDIPGYDAAFAQYFGGVPERDLPATIALRAPLLFGIAESERARHFVGYIARGDLEGAGRLMSLGHDGDRVCARGGEAPFRQDWSDTALARLCAEGVPIEACPGAYGASSPALDALVDAALDAGALGACLTGAGIAGSVLVLCRRGEADAIRMALAVGLASERYARIAGLRERIAADAAADGVIENHATAGAGELRLM